MNISRLLGATALAGTFLISAPAFAQTTPATGQGQTQSEGDSETAADQSGKQGTADSLSDTNDAPAATDVVVTGSRIRSPNVTADVPITSIGGDAIFQTADQNVGELLNDLPQLASTFSQQNPGSGIGIAGLNLLDLRGLGTSRTLVLVNGRRHVPADILNNAVSPDVASIPNDLIERVDIVTGGNSAVYGSDAIAGVVNFVLRRSFDGLQLRATAGTTEAGFGGNQYVSAMAGKNFAGGRGNITLHGEYSRQERVFASDVPSFRTQAGLFTVDADAGTTANPLVNGGDGFSDAVFLSDVRSGTISPNGLIAINQRNAPNGLCGNASAANNGPTNNNGAAFSCSFIFSGDGRLVEQTGTRFGTGINASRIGGNGQTGREGRTVSILPELERYNFNLLAHFEFAPALELFFEGKYNRVNALGNNAGPSFVQSPSAAQGSVGDFRERSRLDNPFLNPADRTTLTNLIIASGCRPSLQDTCPAAGNLTPTDIAAINAGTFRVQVSRNLLDVGLRDEDFQRDTYRAVLGARGTFNGDWSYEISGNYGRFDQTQTTRGFIDRQRFSLALDAGRNPLTGAIQCRSQFDPTAVVPDQRTDTVAVANRAANTARLAADVAACRPYNPFGAADNSAAIAYFSSTFSAEASLEQIVGQAFVSGDLSQLFELPGGPVRFAVGGEYRREKAFYQQDAVTTQGFNNGVSIPVFDPPAFEVKEAFGEIQIPLLKDTPFFQELTVSAAGRVSDYKSGIGTVYAYNAGAQWSPIRDLRIRGNYARAVRAPNVSETGFPLVPNFANNITDPCDTTRINGGSATRRANCVATVGQANLVNLPDRAYSLAIVSGSNPNLAEETSDSYTLGAVLQPRFVPGLALTVDYYNIRVNGIISTVTVQGILNNCVDLPTTTNVFCSAFTRFQGAGSGPNGELPGAVLGNSLINAPLNFAKREREGIDVNLQYRTNFGENLRFSTNLIYVHNLRNSNFEDPTNPSFENRILSESGFPQDEARLDIDLGFKEFTFGYRLRFIGEQFTSTYENFRGGVNGLPAANVDAIQPQEYPVITYSDIRFEWNAGGDSQTGAGDRSKGLRFYFGVDNVLNQLPPLGSTATGVGTAIYDFRGRSYYAGARVRF
ncbi:TonB-dependent receptor domain-containing protein [Sphingomonas sp.]|jgi:outer membrane receptor protein involved in Fe transport|uniref:TonB-dependent receptor domain-containing protein n=1 Tax=Sphingomonas sp. TaxID=28214 RepID=UPI002D80A806|nr:TonB-dependent receptor [Sphingomonas sp.]HEU0042962.1 TonB-dependent receptor [Sphingomonas sp.]